MTELEAENKRLRERVESQRRLITDLMNDHFRSQQIRNRLIAEEVLRWKDYPSDFNDEQRIYAPSFRAANAVGLGEDLWKLVDAEIDRIAKERWHD